MVVDGHFSMLPLLLVLDQMDLSGNFEGISIFTN